MPKDNKTSKMQKGISSACGRAKCKVIFMGTPEFGAIILKELAKEYKPVLVITSPDKPVGRNNKLTPPPVKETAQNLNIPVFQTEDNSEILSKIKEVKADLLISAACGQILPKEVLQTPKYGSLNIHPSLLPKYRGPSPIQTAILKGDKETGITIILMDEKIDHGKIISSYKFSISNKKISYPELSKKLAKLGAELLIETIPKWTKDKIKPQPQNELKATYTKILKKEDGRINWSESAENIERKIRAFCPWPGSFSFWQEKRLKIIEAKVKDFKKYLPPGKTFSKNNLLCIKCQDKSLIIKKIQFEGKKPMNSEEFLKGHSDFIGLKLK